MKVIRPLFLIVFVTILLKQIKSFRLNDLNAENIFYPPVPTEEHALQPCGKICLTYTFPMLVKTITNNLGVTTNVSYSDEADPEITPGLFQGDIAIDDETFNDWRVGLRRDIFPKKLWKRGVVSYVISPLYDVPNTITILKAIKWLNALTCIRLIKWNGKTKDYIYIAPVKYPKGCWSFVGRQGGKQILSLTPTDDKNANCLGTEGRAMHELMHAIGIFHEQSRADRDKFVKIHTENIAPGFKMNFSKQSLKNTTYAFEYDYNSIMHYGKYYFSVAKGKPTITAKKPEGNNIGQRNKLSVTDCLKINHLYGCLADSRRAQRYYRVCKMFGF